MASERERERERETEAEISRVYNASLGREHVRTHKGISWPGKAQRVYS